MFDINFYMKTFALKKKIMQGLIKDKNYIMRKFEELRSKEPIVFTIETTNACNMRCLMCPRTTLMTRKVLTMGLDTFKRIAGQIRPHPKNLWSEWEDFVQEKYGISKTGMSENHFFLYVIPRVLVLHGYGDPLLDPYMPKRIKFLSERNIPSYFSCNPANIDIDKSLEIFKNGLDYIKYSIESMDDLAHKKIRGKASNFTQSYKKIVQLLDIKEKYKFKVKIIITMLNLVRPTQVKEFLDLKEAFKGRDVYLYLKSQDQQWYRNSNGNTKSIHWTEFCQFPWSSMTINSGAEAVGCITDYNNEIVLGDVDKDTLYDIWNNRNYKMFRESHFLENQIIKCFQRCDMPIAGRLIESYGKNTVCLS